MPTTTPFDDDTSMRAALDALTLHVADAQARVALADDEAFTNIREVLAVEVPGVVPDGERGDNLLRALLALRVKFPPDEARAKLETNLSMRRTPSAVSGRMA